MYIAVRADLSAGSQVAQAAHAAFLFSAEYPSEFQAWHQNSNYLVVVSVPDENALMDLASRALRTDIGVSLFHEPDLNEELTAIAIEPGDTARKLCSNFPLALKETAKVPP